MEVMATEKGRRLWRFLGDTFDGKFYLYKNSKNIKVFHKYMEEENERNKKNKYVDIGDDFTEEQLISNNKALDSMKEVFDKMTPEEWEIYLKQLCHVAIPEKLL